MESALIILGCLFYLNANLQTNTINVTVNYKVTSHQMCLSSGTILYNTIKVSVGKCVEECASVPECIAINYKRLYKTCELHSSQHASLVAQSGESCLYVKRSDINLIKLHTKECQECEESDCETNRCPVKYCSALDVVDGELHGNMRAIGSRVEITCDKYFKEISDMKHVICQSNGLWNYRPKCIPNYQYIGCFEDRPVRILEEKAIYTERLTTDMCARICIDFDFEYSLTEATYTCFCGNTPRNYALRPDSECNMPCAGNASEICGGNWRGSLYRHF